MVPSFISGLFLPNIIFFFFVTFNLIFFNKEIINIIRNHSKVFSIFIFFCLFLIISSIISDNVMHSLGSSALYFSFSVYVISISFLFDNRKYRIIFLFFCTVTMFFLSLDSIFEFFNGKNILGYSSIEGRIASLFNNRWLLGRYLIYFLPLLIGIFFIELPHLYKGFKIFFCTTIFLCCLSIIFSGERAAFILFFIFLFLIFLYLFKKVNKKLKFIFLLIILGFLVIPFLFPVTSQRLQHNFILYATSLDFSKNQYYSMWLTSLKMFIDNPVFGIGPNNFRNSCNELPYYVSNWSCSTHPHNTSFQILSEIGVIGFILVYSVFIYFCLKLIQIIKTNHFSHKTIGFYSICSAKVLYLFPLMITGNFFLSWYGFIYYLAVGFFFVYKDNILKEVNV